MGHLCLDVLMKKCRRRDGAVIWRRFLYIRGVTMVISSLSPREYKSIIILLGTIQGNFFGLIAGTGRTCGRKTPSTETFLFHCFLLSETF